MQHRWHMTPAHGVRAVAVAVVAEAAGTTASPDHSIAIAVISVVGGFAVMLCQLTVTDWLRNRRTLPKHPDHDEEQAVLNELLIEKLGRLEAENDRLRRKGRS